VFQNRTHLYLPVIVEGLQLGAHQLEEHAALLVELLLQAGHVDLDEERLGQAGVGGGHAPQCIQHALVDGRGHSAFGLVCLFGFLRLCL